MRNLIALTLLVFAAVLVCRSQPQGGGRGVMFQNRVQILDVECSGVSTQCYADKDGTLWLDGGVYESKSGTPFRTIECGPSLSCKVEGGKLIITGSYGGGR